MLNEDDTYVDLYIYIYTYTYLFIYSYIHTYIKFSANFNVIKRDSQHLSSQEWIVVMQ